MVPMKAYSISNAGELIMKHFVPFEHIDEGRGQRKRKKRNGLAQFLLDYFLDCVQRI